MLLYLLPLLTMLSLFSIGSRVPLPLETPPNVIVVLADDLGYGDVRYLNPTSKIRTPHLDALARSGMTFSDAHSNSSVCTPTRYGLLTGRYAWRSRLKSGVLGPYSAPLIEPGRPTLASLLKWHGYATACIGKWHLGLDWSPKKADQPLFWGPEIDPDSTNVDFSKPLSTLSQVGFEESFVIAASLDMAPYLFVKNGACVGPVNEFTFGNGQMVKGRAKGTFWRKGDQSAGFRPEEVLPTMVREAERFIRRKSTQPFFLYLPLPSPHTPWVPQASFRGTSKAGAYGDYVEETDWAVGRIIRLLDSLRLTENTLLVFTSDNGAYWDADDVAEFNHRANAHWRGQKADIHEAGHRVPFLMRWPGRVRAGSHSAGLLCLTDLYATLADLLGQPLNARTAEDSFSFLDTLLGKKASTAPRQSMIHHSLDSVFAIRQGDWKLIWGQGSGGFTAPKRVAPQSGAPFGQLYHLRTDPAETRNRWAEQPEVVRLLSGRLESDQRRGYSRPMGPYSAR